MYIEKVEKFGDLPIKMRIDPQGGFADIFADENFYKAQGLSGSKEMAYRLGFNAEQVRNSDKHLPKWVRFYSDGRIGHSPFDD